MFEDINPVYFGYLTATPQLSKQIFTIYHYLI